MDEFDLKVNKIIEKKLESMTNLTIPNHAHNGYDVNQIDPAIGLLGWPVIQTTRGVLTTSTLFGGTIGYTSQNNVATTGGTGVGLTVNITAVAGVVTIVVVNNPGVGYTIGDVITITGGDGTATFQVATVSDATVAPTDIPSNGTFRFYVDATPNYRLWAYLTYQNATGVLVPAWKSITLT